MISRLSANRVGKYCTLIRIVFLLHSGVILRKSIIKTEVNLLLRELVHNSCAWFEYITITTKKHSSPVASQRGILERCSLFNALKNHTTVLNLNELKLMRLLCWNCKCTSAKGFSFMAAFVTWHKLLISANF